MLIIIFLLNIFTMSKQECPEVPTTCERGKISFFLYTKSCREPHELILDDVNTIKNAPYIPNENFKFIVHGYIGNRTYPEVLVELREEYFKQKPWNLIIVDWGPLAIDGCYESSAFHSIPLVGKCCADLLKAIFHHKPEIKIDNFHVIGFSMGAHVCASFANNLKPMLLPRLTGLDPAFPLFTEPISDKDDLLNRQHAKFVDVLHTNMANYGVLFSNAHYDIYVENGTKQPGCGIFDFSCSHRRAVQIFAESINSKTKFFADKCKNNWVFVTIRKCNGDREITIEIGEHIEPQSREEETGTYYLEINDRSPFAKGCPEL